MVAIFVLSPFTASALDRVGGQFWTYDASMIVSGSNASGSITYTLSGKDSVVSNGISYDADVMTIAGNLSSSSYLFGVPYSLRTQVGGTRYESSGGIATIEDDLKLWTDISIGSDPLQLVARVQTENITTYSPPYLSGFDPSNVNPGDSWRETVTLNVTIIENGTVARSVTHDVVMDVVVGSSFEDVRVGAGTFKTLRITSTDGNGAREVHWWSSKVQNFVLEKRYDPLGTRPSAMMSLTEYESDAGNNVLIAVVLGAALVGVAVVILLVILRSRGRDPARLREPGGLVPGRPVLPDSRGRKAPGRIEREPER